MSLPLDTALVPAPVSDLGVTNRVMAALPAPLRGALLARADLVELAWQTDLLRAGEPVTQLVFPLEGFVSVLQPVAGGGTVPLALVGHEGVLDVPALLGLKAGSLSGQTWRVQAAGLAFALPLAVMAAHRGEPALQAVLQAVLQAHAALRYAQLAQQLLCLNQHGVLQRLARCLLMARDRVQAPELFLTHDSLAQMLGARRESVTLAAGRLQRRGLISYSRGYLMLLDAPALHALACPCYDADRESAAAASASAASGSG